MSDTLVYGARCTWWDSIEKAGRRDAPVSVGGRTISPARLGRPGLPCCPRCGSVLFQQEDDKWWEDVRQHEANGNPGYEEFVRWMRGRCFPSMKHAQEAKAIYDAAREARKLLSPSELKALEASVAEVLPSAGRTKGER